MAQSDHRVFGGGNSMPGAKSGKGSKGSNHCVAPNQVGKYGGNKYPSGGSGHASKGSNHHTGSIKTG